MKNFQRKTFEGNPLTSHLSPFRCETTLVDCPLQSVRKNEKCFWSAVGQRKVCLKKVIKLKSEIESGSSPLNFGHTADCPPLQSTWHQMVYYFDLLCLSAMCPYYVSLLCLSAMSPHYVVLFCSTILLSYPSLFLTWTFPKHIKDAKNELSLFGNKLVKSETQGGRRLFAWSSRSLNCPPLSLYFVPNRFFIRCSSLQQLKCTMVYGHTVLSTPREACRFLEERKREVLKAVEMDRVSSVATRLIRRSVLA